MAVACSVVAYGCAQAPLYDWGRYEDSLQASYVTHDEAHAQSDLETTINVAKGRRIPPGVCAEYGFMLYKHGQRERAIEYFEQEAQLFPESKPLMDKLVAKVRAQTSSDPQAAAGGGAVR
ncbi:MAG: DUF4810 domain-containing protein [Deltaproteobacteria bacterium]|nr:DUF4810 domain-containing protein [Deltaproteobacteria bacterium]